MPFTDPVVESITANIAAELAEITTANGWNYTLSVIRPKDFELGKETWGDGTVLVVQTDDDPLTDGNGLRQQIQNYAITAFVSDGDNATAPSDTKKNRVTADIKKKLMETPKRGHANVTWTKIGKSLFFRPGNAGIGGVILDVAVEYQTQSTNPYA